MFGEKRPKWGLGGRRLGVMLVGSWLLGAGPQALAADDLGPELEAIRSEFGVPGLAAVAFRWNALLGIGATGVRKAGDATALTTADQFHLGSITKSMTATLAAILVEEGKVRWETTIGEVWGSRKVLEVYRGVDLRTLMRHRGALAVNTVGDPWREVMRPEGSPRRQRERCIRGALEMEPRFPPGSKAEYANLNFVVAGGMLEELADQPWEVMVAEKLWTPLRMKEAGLGPMASPGEVDQPWGHRDDGTPVAPDEPGADNPPSLAPAGTVHCSLRDVARYGAFHLSRGKSAPKVLKDESFAILHGDANDGDIWALGWMRADRPWAGGIALNHGGSNTMNRAVIWLAPEIDFGVAVATNQGGRVAAVAIDRAVNALIARYVTQVEKKDLSDKF